MLRSLAVVFAVLPMLMLAAEASAHQDGCHRWHSCPSDTGSYVCGDLGYYDQCPTVAAPPAAPPPPGNLYNCADFPSQAAAQAALRADPTDPNVLDRDRDGIACEWNPGPYDRVPVAR